MLQAKIGPGGPLFTPDQFLHDNTKYGQLSISLADELCGHTPGT